MTEAVHPTPVLTINIDRETITVERETLRVDDGRSPHEVAIHHAARTVAQPLNRPVRAIATDDSGRTSLVIHPDGHASDVQQLDLAEPVASGAAASTPAAPGEPATSGALPAGEAAPSSRRDTSSPPPTALPERGQPRSFLTEARLPDTAETGWRGLLVRIGLRTRPSAAEQAERNDRRVISQHWPGPRTIAVVNAKGGSGKTPTSVILSALFARYGGAGVLAWDNNETRGTLGWRTEQGPHEALDLLPQSAQLLQPTARAADLAAYIHHQTEDKFDVLRSNPQLLPQQQRLTAEDFDAIHRVATKYFRLIFVDSGNDETAPHWLRMIDRAEQIVVATTTRPDHAEAGRLLLDALRQRDQHSARLADQAVVVVSQADREEASADRIAAGYHGIARTAVTVPYDKAIRAPWLRFRNLDPATRRAYLRAAAEVGRGL